jgi:hypothetical protein
MPGKHRDIKAGDRFGQRTVIRQSSKDEWSHRYFEAQCDCGEVWVHRIDYLLACKDGRPCRKCGLPAPLAHLRAEKDGAPGV